MKKLFTTIVALITGFGLLSVTAQEAQEEKATATLEGWWQMCMFQQGDSGKFDVRVLPVIKAYNQAGTYSTLITRTFGGSCGLAEEGTFKKENDSTLVETTSANEVLTYTFHLQGPQWLVLDTKDAEGKATHQIWMRLRKMPNAQKMLEGIQKGEFNGPRGFNRPDRPQGGQMHQGRPGQRGNRGGMRQRGENAPEGFNPGGNESGIDNSWMNEE